MSVLGVARARAAAGLEAVPRENAFSSVGAWSPEKFAREQIRSLVRTVFSPSMAPVVRQVVFSPIEPETQVQAICRRVAEELATETLQDVAVMAGEEQMLPDGEMERAAVNHGSRPLRESAARLRGNLWLAPVRGGGDSVTTTSLHAYLGDLRREFEYSIVAAPGGELHEAIGMAQFADGIILVLSAERTRRAIALKVRDALQGAHVRLLGAVLSDREFPMPGGIYRHL